MLQERYSRLLQGKCQFGGTHGWISLLTRDSLEKQNLFSFPLASCYQSITGKNNIIMCVLKKKLAMSSAIAKYDCAKYQE